MYNSIRDIFKTKLEDFFLEKITARDYNFEVFKKDVFVISYPKSGNTWMLFLIANLMTEDEIDFDNLGKYVSDIYLNSDKEIQRYRSKKDIKIFKSHSYFRPKYSPNKVIYIVRDPRDVLISYYYWYIYRVKKMSLNRFFEKFMFTQLNTYGTWGENVGSWLGARGHDDNFLLIRYEDMLSDTYRELKRVCTFLNLDVSKYDIEESVKSCDFNVLQEKQINDSQVMAQNYDKLFFRKGTSGQWKDELEKKHVGMIENNFGPLMKRLGYIAD